MPQRRLQPGDAFTGLEAGDSSIGADAFTIGGTTFDPTLAAGGTEGFTPVDQLIGAPPLLEIGGGTPTLSVPSRSRLAPQDFNVYDGTGASATEVGSIIGNEDVTDLLGLTNTEFTVASVTPARRRQCFGPSDSGIGLRRLQLRRRDRERLHRDPGRHGAADTVTDTLVTPFGNIDLGSLFGGIDAVSPLDPGAAFTRLDATRGLRYRPAGVPRSVEVSRLSTEYQTSQALSGLGCLAFR